VTEPRVGFSEGCKVVVEQLETSDKEWKVREPFSYRARRDTYEIGEGMLTDFASVPRVFVWLLPRYGRYTKAAILHDYLWREKAANGEMDWIDADGVFRRAMRELRVPFLRRWMMWSAVRWAALLKPRGRHRWWREAPRVLLVTALVAPVVVPPALLILVALVLFFVEEAVLWVVLRASEAVRGKVGRPTDKQVNAPQFDWKLG
jgi:hypothetical protein